MAQNDNVFSSILDQPLITGVGGCNCPSCVQAALRQFPPQRQAQVTRVDVSYDYNGGRWLIEGTGMPPARSNPDGSYTLDFTQIAQSASSGNQVVAMPGTQPVMITTTTNNTGGSTTWNSGGGGSAIFPANDLDDVTKERINKLRANGETYSEFVNRALNLLEHLVEKIEDHQTGGCPL